MNKLQSLRFLSAFPSISELLSVDLNPIIGRLIGQIPSDKAEEPLSQQLARDTPKLKNLQLGLQQPSEDFILGLVVGLPSL